MSGTATAANPGKKKLPTKKKKKSGADEVTRLTTRLEKAESQLAVVNRFLEKVELFSNVVADAKERLAELREEEFTLKEQLTEVRSSIRSLTDLLNSTNDGMLAILEPGPVKFMPLFDKMEPANPETHGKNAGKWREKPLSVLRLPPLIASLLHEADILFIGQLQDLIINGGEEWWKTVEGLEQSKAAAVADRLEDFVSKGGDE